MLLTYIKRRTTVGENDRGGRTQRAGRDPNSDTYTSLDVQNGSSDYDTLTVVNRAARHTNTELQTSAQTSDTYASLDVNSRSPEYDTLVVKGAAAHSHTKM
ncbi:hypothetical protein GN956_G25465 [Arapaima gigas]